MFQHILVPLDGSTRAEQALPIVARLAHASQGTITLLHVVDLIHNTLAFGITAPYIAQNTIEDAFSDARRYLEQQRQKPCLEGIRVQTQVVGGNPAEVIIDQATDSPVDLIVICSHGYTGMKRWIMGSVAEKVARYALVPVLVLHEEKPLSTQRDFDGYGTLRVLVPLDTAPRSQDSLVPAAELAAALSTPGQGELHLAQMIKVPENANAAQKEELFRAARQNLAAISQSIRDGLVTRFGPELHPTLTWSVSQADDIAEGIVRVAETDKELTTSGEKGAYDLIAMTTHGAGGSHWWPVGSIAERVLRATDLPILIVRPEDMIVKIRQQRDQQAKAAV